MVERAALIRMAMADGAASKDALREWAQTDPRHEAAAAAVASSWAIFDHPDAGDAANQVFARVQERRQKARRFRWRAGIGAIAASLVLAVLSPWQEAAQAYATGIGTGRTMVLSDGSRIALDGDSAVRVRITADANEVWLERGQARFQSGRHPIPIEVHAGSRKIVAQAGTFDIELLRDRAIITSVRGPVMISPDGLVSRMMTALPFAPSSAITLLPGQQLSVDGAAAASVGAPSAVVVDAWQSGRLVMADMPLGDAVARINRQSLRPVVLADPALANLRLSGVLGTRDGRQFADIVAMHLPLAVSRGADGKIILSRR